MGTTVPDTYGECAAGNHDRIVNLEPARLPSVNHALNCAQSEWRLGAPSPQQCEKTVPESAHPGDAEGQPDGKRCQLRAPK
jgi:hypothetical protein